MTQYHIPEPCHEDWDAMTPEEKGRFCKVCEKSVVDLTAMPAEKAQGLLDEAHARQKETGSQTLGVCVHSYVRPAPVPKCGHVLTSGMAALLAFGASGCGSENDEKRVGLIEPDHELRMGEAMAPVDQGTPQPCDLTTGDVACVEGVEDIEGVEHQAKPAQAIRGRAEAIGQVRVIKGKVRPAVKPIHSTVLEVYKTYTVHAVFDNAEKAGDPSHYEAHPNKLRVRYVQSEKFKSQSDVKKWIDAQVK